jgi:hypothetical protein
MTASIPGWARLDVGAVSLDNPPVDGVLPARFEIGGDNRDYH